MCECLLKERPTKNINLKQSTKGSKQSVENVLVQFLTRYWVGRALRSEEFYQQPDDPNREGCLRLCIPAEFEKTGALESTSRIQVSSN